MGDPLNDVSLLRVGMRDCGGVLLEALESYWQASQAEREAVCNGAGPTWLQAWLPWWLRWLRALANRLWWCDGRVAFDIHDWDYVTLPLTLAGKFEADGRLEANLRRIILSRRGAPGWLTWMRLRNARRYVRLVREFGFKAYFDRGEGEGRTTGQACGTGGERLGTTGQACGTGGERLGTTGQARGRGEEAAGQGCGRGEGAMGQG